MLKGINPIISPELLKVIHEMGHSDMILFADGNFPVHSYGIPVIRLDGMSITPILESVLPLFPLDSFVENPVTLMQPNADFGREPSVWSSYRKIIAKYEPSCGIEGIERFQFYDKCKSVYRIVATTEAELYASVILQKGVIFPES